MCVCVCVRVCVCVCVCVCVQVFDGAVLVTQGDMNTITIEVSEYDV